MELKGSEQLSHIAHTVQELLGRATERMRREHEESEYDSLDMLVQTTLSSWEWDRLQAPVVSRRRRNDTTKAPRVVQDTRDIIALPDETVEKLGARADLLRGYLSQYDGDPLQAILDFERAQSGYLAEGNLRSFAQASSKLARVAREQDMPLVAEEAHRAALRGYIGSQELDNDTQIEKGTLEAVNASPYDLKSLYEYRHLAKTLSMPAAIAMFGSSKLKALKEEVLDMQVAKGNSVYAVLALMQIEIGLNHYRKARHLGYICSAADMGGGLGMQIMIQTLKTGKVPPQNFATVKQWSKFFSKHAPDMIIEGMNYWSDHNSSYW